MRKMTAVLPLILFLLFHISASAQSGIITLATKDFQCKINSTGQVISLYDLAGKTEYCAPKQSSPLIRIKAGNEFEEPSSARQVPSKEQIILNYNKAGVAIVVAYSVKPTHLVFEITDINPKEKVDLVLWGPVATSINKTVGEIIGVVRNDNYAIGIQSLNVKTVGGYPVKEEGFEFGRGRTAECKDWGSILQAYSIDRSKKRNITVWNDQWPNMPVEPIAGETVIGSRIALFGCSEKEALKRIGDIEIAEGLPHPMIDGVWSKISPQTGRSYLISDYSESTIDELLGYTKRANLMTLYHMEMFESWGHYEINKKDFPNGVEGLKKCVGKAKAMGIRLGAHTLTNFINTNDPYVTPVPDKRLVKTGSGVLTADISETEKNIPVYTPEYFNNGNANQLHTVVIDNELIRYRMVTPAAPYTLVDCVRGAFGTKPASHSKDAAAGKLADHGYKIFFPNIEMQREIAVNLAKRFNETGLSQMDFDGHEGCGATGQGDYAIDLFAKDFYDNLDHAVINGTSNSKHFYWHINTYCNWGEPWYEGFRENMQEYRINNQALLERNFLPNMLGWYLMTGTTTLSDIEWMLARAAGYNAGFALVAELDALRKNPETPQILDALREWESARHSNVFSAAQKELLKNPKNEFHLETIDEKSWKLYPFHASQEYIYEKTIRQPGEPVSVEWLFDNTDKEQPMQFRLKAFGGNGTVINPSFEIDNFTLVTYNVELKNNETLLCEGAKTARVYDNKGRQIKTVDANIIIPHISNGRHKINFNCEFTGDQPLTVKVIFKTIGDADQVIKH
jgi:hypothetical protein